MHTGGEGSVRAQDSAETGNCDWMLRAQRKLYLVDERVENGATLVFKVAKEESTTWCSLPLWPG